MPGRGRIFLPGIKTREQLFDRIVWPIYEKDLANSSNDQRRMLHRRGELNKPSSFNIEVWKKFLRDVQKFYTTFFTHRFHRSEKQDYTKVQR